MNHIIRTLIFTAFLLPILLITPTAAEDTSLLPASELRETPPVDQEYAADRIFVMYSPDTAETGSASHEILKDYSCLIPGLQLIQLPADITVEEALQYYADLPGVLYAEPDYSLSLPDPELSSDTTSLPVPAGTLRTRGHLFSRISPDDPLFPYQWALENSGEIPIYEDPGYYYLDVTGGSDISAADAWAITTGSSDIIVAVLDTGINYNHEDLADNMWRSPDGYHGRDFVNQDNDPMDDNGHGTHCAGIIGAVGNNGIGITGISWNLSLMSVKVLDETGSGFLSTAISGLEYASRNGADIISISLGTDSFSSRRSYQAAVDAIPSAVIVCCAGNENTDNDVHPFYPASCLSDNLIAVAASGMNDTLSAYSNYGQISVDVAAPGNNLLSASHISDTSYVYMSGTSMATPMVAGTAALMLSANPDLTPGEVVALIRETVDTKASLSGKVGAGGRINAAAAIRAAAHATDPPEQDSEDKNLSSLTLNSGWNFISVPKTLSPDNNTVSSLFGSVNSGGRSPLAYNADPAQWSVLTETDIISPLTGYWLYATSPVEIPLTYSTQPEEIPASKPLYPGWNAIGLSSDTTTTVENALAGISWRTLIPWNLTTGAWDTAILNGGSGINSADERLMITGTGYWLYVSEAGMFRGLTS